MHIYVPKAKYVNPTIFNYNTSDLETHPPTILPGICLLNQRGYGQLFFLAFG